MSLINKIIGPLEPGAVGGARVTQILEAMGAKSFTWNYPIFVFAHPPSHILDFPTPLFMIEF